MSETLFAVMLLIGLSDVPESTASTLCLTEAMFWEARGEPVEGHHAVAEVVLARVDSDKFPNTVCSVVHQPSKNPNRRLACAFSFSCGKKDRRIPEKEIYTWNQLLVIAVNKVTAKSKTDYTKGALHYVVCSKKSKITWAKKLPTIVKIGKHCFME